MPSDSGSPSSSGAPAPRPKLLQRYKGAAAVVSADPMEPVSRQAEAEAERPRGVEAVVSEVSKSHLVLAVEGKAADVLEAARLHKGKLFGRGGGNTRCGYVRLGLPSEVK